jgi:hypothetical protein
VQGKLSAVREGEKIILLIDNEHKIIDVAIPEKQRG